VTNETYLVVSYFTALAAAVVLALLTITWLRGGARRALAGRDGKLANFLRRVLSPWVVLVAMFAFLSVSYFDCSHKNYQAVVQDREHLEDVSRSHASRITGFVTFGVFCYAVALTLALAVTAKIATKNQR